MNTRTRIPHTLNLLIALVFVAGCSGSSDSGTENTEVTFRAVGTLAQDCNANPGNCPTGVATGNQMIFDLTLDNGSKDLNARAWTYDTLKRVVVRIGPTYVMIIDPARLNWLDVEGSFTTDAAGNINGVPVRWDQEWQAGTQMLDVDGNPVMKWTVNHKLWYYPDFKVIFSAEGQFSSPQHWTILP